LQPLGGQQDGRFFLLCAPEQHAAAQRFAHALSCTYHDCHLGDLRPFRPSQLHPHGAVIAVHAAAEHALDVHKPETQKQQPIAPPIGTVSSKATLGTAGNKPAVAYPAAAQPPESVQDKQNSTEIAPCDAAEADSWDASQVCMPFSVLPGHAMPAYASGQAEEDQQAAPSVTQAPGAKCKQPDSPWSSVRYVASADRHTAQEYSTGLHCTFWPAPCW
jgi:hypothetical protein